MTATPMSTPDALEQALDIDLNDFLEPLPEEEQLLQLSAKENNPPTVPSTASTPRNLSPDLFAEDSVSPWHPATTTTAAPVAAATVPPKSLAAKLAAKSILRSPEGRQRSVPVSAEKSPSIFENYLQRMRGRGQLSRAAQRLHYTSSNQQVAEQPAGEQEQPAAKQEPHEEDSPIMRRRPSKRKIVEISDDEEEAEQQQQMEEMDMIPATQLLLDDSFEQVPSTQAVSR